MKLLNLLAWFILVLGYSSRMRQVVDNLDIQRGSFTWLVLLVFFGSIPIAAIYYFI